MFWKVLWECGTIFGGMHISEGGGRGVLEGSRGDVLQ